MDMAMAKCEVIIEEILDTDFVLFDVIEEEDSLIDITNTNDDVNLSGK